MNFKEILDKIQALLTAEENALNIQLMLQNRGSTIGLPVVTNAANDFNTISDQLTLLLGSELNPKKKDPLVLSDVTTLLKKIGTMPINLSEEASQDERLAKFYFAPYFKTFLTNLSEYINAITNDLDIEVNEDARNIQSAILDYVAQQETLPSIISAGEKALTIQQKQLKAIADLNAKLAINSEDVAKQQAIINELNIAYNELNKEPKSSLVLARMNEFKRTLDSLNELLGLKNTTLRHLEAFKNNFTIDQLAAYKRHIETVKKKLANIDRSKKPALLQQTKAEVQKVLGYFEKNIELFEKLKTLKNEIDEFSLAAFNDVKQLADHQKKLQTFIQKIMSYDITNQSGLYKETYQAATASLKTLTPKLKNLQEQAKAEKIAEAGRVADAARLEKEAEAARKIELNRIETVGLDGIKLRFFNASSQESFTSYLEKRKVKYAIKDTARDFFSAVTTFFSSDRKNREVYIQELTNAFNRYYKDRDPKAANTLKIKIQESKQFATRNPERAKNADGKFVTVDNSLQALVSNLEADLDKIENYKTNLATPIVKKARDIPPPRI